MLLFEPVKFHRLVGSADLIGTSDDAKAILGRGHFYLVRLESVGGAHRVKLVLEGRLERVRVLIALIGDFSLLDTGVGLISLVPVITRFDLLKTSRSSYSGRLGLVITG